MRHIEIIKRGHKQNYVIIKLLSLIKINMKEAMNFENFKKPEENFETEISAVEAEVGNLKDAVIEILGKRGNFKLAQDIDAGKISLGLHEQKFLNMGELAEKEAQKRGENFDSTEFLLTRANLIADELINSTE